MKSITIDELERMNPETITVIDIRKEENTSPSSEKEDSDCRQSPGKSRAFLHLWPFFWYNRNIRRAVFFYDDKKFR